MANKLAPLFMANGRADNFRSIYKREIVPKEYKKYDWQQKNWGDEIFRLFLSYYNIIISEILGKIKFWDSKNFEVSKNLKMKENWSRIIIEVSEKRRKIDSGGWCVVKAE